MATRVTIDDRYNVNPYTGDQYPSIIPWPVVINLLMIISIIKVFPMSLFFRRILMVFWCFCVTLLIVPVDTCSGVVIPGNLFTIVVIWYYYLLIRLLMIGAVVIVLREKLMEM